MIAALALFLGYITKTRPPSPHPFPITTQTLARGGLWRGGIAQLGERLLCKQEVIGSIPFASTSAEIL